MVPPAEPNAPRALTHAGPRKRQRWVDDRRGRHITYGEFGHRFVELAVSPDRVAGTIAAVAGERLDLGPLRAGPGEAATVTATGLIGAPDVAPAGDGELRTFRATLPVTLDLRVVVAGTDHRYDVELAIPLHLTVRTAIPLDLVVDITTPRPRDIRVDLRAGGLGAKVLQKVGNIEDEIRRQAAQFVRDRVDAPAAAGARIIEPLPLIDEAWRPPAR